MYVSVIFQCVHRCRSHDMSPLSHIPKRKTGTSLPTPYGFGLGITHSVRWIEHRPRLIIQAAVVRHAPEMQLHRYVRHGAKLGIHFILDSVISPTTWSRSCCRPTVLLLAMILLLYCRIHSFTSWLRTISIVVYLHHKRCPVFWTTYYMQIISDPALGRRNQSLPLYVLIHRRSTFSHGVTPVHVFNKARLGRVKYSWNKHTQAFCCVFLWGWHFARNREGSRLQELNTSPNKQLPKEL